MSPITKSAKKALRKEIKRRRRNLAYKRKVKNLIKEIRNLVLEKNFKEAKELLPKVYKILDKASKKKVIKKNTAGRRKSRLAKLIIRSGV